MNGKIYCKYSINKFSNSEHKMESDDSLSLISLGFHILDYVLWMLLHKTTQIYSRFIRYPNMKESLLLFGILRNFKDKCFFLPTLGNWGENRKNIFIWFISVISLSFIPPFLFSTLPVCLPTFINIIEFFRSNSSFIISSCPKFRVI